MVMSGVAARHPKRRRQRRQAEQRRGGQSGVSGDGGGVARSSLLLASAPPLLSSPDRQPFVLGEHADNLDTTSSVPTTIVEILSSPLDGTASLGRIWWRRRPYSSPLFGKLLRCGSKLAGA
uniref:Uncharacterized protein n=1 Tax=Oryza nivara TaxID=4536 RepID=A0A0E0J165_ORYNI